MNLLLKYYYTLSYLKPIQLFGRLIAWLYRPSPKLVQSTFLRKPINHWSSSPPKNKTLIAPSTFFFLNLYGDLKKIGWNGPQRSLLWRYNQHYFDFLNSEKDYITEDQKISLISNWIEENAPYHSVGWEPYPTSLRIVNWIKASINGTHFSNEILCNLFAQCSMLSKRVEIHLLGNHILANAKALIFGGLFFVGRDAANWLDKGMRIVNQQINEQILSDGGHFERSPMYHSIILEDILDIINICNVFHEDNNFKNNFVTRLENKAINMLYWLSAMCHPDREISFFNDSTFGIAQDFDSLYNYASSIIKKKLPEILNISCILPETGYVRLQNKDLTAILDVAKIGPDYIPGHAHADTLSFELSYKQQRVLVNSGISTYESVPQRYIQRSTISHNTVEINDKSSSEVWSSFRVARRALPQNLVYDIKDKASLMVSCSHNGYQRMCKDISHKRSWKLEDDVIEINDHITGTSNKAKARFYLHPLIRLHHDVINKRVELFLREDRLAVFSVLKGEIAIAESTWHPGFGITKKNQCIIVSLVNCKSKVKIKF